jgi:predicted DNA-binding protein
MKSNVATTPLPCRFDIETRQRLDRFTRATGIPRSILIRHGVNQALTEFEHGSCLSFSPRSSR